MLDATGARIASPDGAAVWVVAAAAAPRRVRLAHAAERVAWAPQGVVVAGERQLTHVGAGGLRPTGGDPAGLAVSADAVAVGYSGERGRVEVFAASDGTNSIPQQGAAAANRTAGPEKTSGPGATDMSAFKGVAQYLQPIDAPFVFNGFTEASLNSLAPSSQQAGITPVMGVGSVSAEKQPEPLVPGSAVSAIMVRGDMDVAATCTVTYMDKDHLLACGHPLTQYGMVDMPMTKANVIATLASPLNAFKIVNATEAVGAFVQDRKTGIMGKFDREPQMIPITLNIHGPSGPKEFHYEVLNNPKLTPLMMMATVFNALMGMNQYGEETTYRMNGKIHVSGYPDVKMANMFSPTDSQPTAYAVAMALGEHFGRIYDNPYEAPMVKGVALDFDLERDRHSAVLENARTDVTEARPGDEITIEAVLRPYRGDRIVRRIPVRVPTSVPKGNLRILVSDAETLDHARRGAGSAHGLDLIRPSSC